jgi:REP element-mobilizing transposase RayT
MKLYQDKYRIESSRLRGWDYRSRGWYFVTICARSHAHTFGEVQNREVVLSPTGRIAQSELRTLCQHYDNVQIDEHVVMPNHVHAIVMIDGDHHFSPDPQMKLSCVNASGFASPQAGSLSAIVRSYKAGVTLKCRDLGLEQMIWQSRFHDHLLRGDGVISAVREYIRNNPANWGLDRENPFRPC